MNPNTLLAAITVGGGALVAVTALLLNHRGFRAIDSRFASIDARFASLEASINTRFVGSERRLEVIEADLKNFCKLLAEHDKRISRLENPMTPTIKLEQKARV